MKARVKATGEIVDIMKNIGYPGGYVASNGRTYHDEDLTLIVDEDPDYWTRLEHIYIGMAMQGILANSEFDEVSVADIAITSIKVATSVIKRLKEERK